jgi:hypothetical protein
VSSFCSEDNIESSKSFSNLSILTDASIIPLNIVLSKVLLMGINSLFVLSNENVRFITSFLDTSFINIGIEIENLGILLIELIRFEIYNLFISFGIIKFDLILKS